MMEFVLYVGTKTLVVGLIASIIGFALRRRSAALQRSFWIAAALTLAAIPLLQLSLPKLPVEVSPQSSQQVISGIERAAFVPQPTQFQTASPKGSGLQQPKQSPVVVAFWVYCTIAAALLLRLLAGLLGACIALRASSEVQPRDLDALRLAERFEPQRPWLRLSRQTQAPFTVGWFRPRIVLPADALDWPSEKVEAALVHELAHIRRGDWGLHMLIGVLCAINWADPFMWLAARRFRLAAEQAADDSVLDSGIRASTYAEYLMSLARGMRVQSGVVLPMARKQDMGNRLESILSNRSRHTSRSQLRFFGLLVPALALPVAAFAAEFTSTPPGQRGFNQTLMQGGSVELLSVSKSLPQKVECWSPSGQRLDTPIHTWGWDNTSGHNFEFTLRIKGVEGAYPAYDFNSKGISSTYGANSRLTHVRDDIWVGFGLLSGSDVPKTADLRVGVLTGDWETVFANKPDEFGSRRTSSASFSDGELTGQEDLVSSQLNAGADIILSVSDSSKNRAVRVIGVYGTPTERVEKYATDLGGTVGQILGQSNYRLAKKGLLEVWVQTKNYEWLSFKNVPLRPKE